ncbi:tyrosine-type recombinase/integrase [Castellaniella sp.]|uniref:tyrosine-type recombinase/integrase n=1 Tax=Castellaniella sp. TaxID=1955812 RepID=UPI002AFEB5D2|nr:tyrosine-type recombinase/integrase [Castellaniella sp.]
MQATNIRRQFKIAFQLILMTLVRKSELMLAQWKDMHLNEGEWHIPIENSKTGKPHIVYLSTQALTLFKEFKPLASSSIWVLPGGGTLAKSFANNALNQALKV